MGIKLQHYAVREVRVAVCSAKLALHLLRGAVERGDMVSARQYRIEAREYLAKARISAELSLTYDDVDILRFYAAVKVFPKMPADKVIEITQDEPEQVSAPAASGQLRLLGVLGAQVLRPATGQPLKSSAYVNIESFDGVRPDRIEFPRLGKHWSPASVLVGYQERKGHAVCRA